MEKITAKELNTIMSNLAQQFTEWYEFVDNVAYLMVYNGYATDDILDLEYTGDDYDYIFAQANNFWKTFKKNQF